MVSLPVNGLNQVPVIVPPLTGWFLYHFVTDGLVPQTSFLTLAFTSMFALFSLFNAMWLDMEDNRRLWRSST